MRPENMRMKVFLKMQGIEATPKWIATGSMKGTWRIYNKSLLWTDELREKLTAIGFTGFDGKPLQQFSSGSRFQVFVCGHADLVEGDETHMAFHDNQRLLGRV